MSYLLSFLLLGACIQFSLAQQVCSPPMPCNAVTGLPIAITDQGTVTYTITLQGFNTVIPTDSAISLTTDFLHTYVQDCLVYVTGPNGHVITLLNRNGGIRQSIYNGTVWTDSAEYNAASYPIHSLPVPIPTLKPLVGKFSDFWGTNPNGNWVLTFVDAAQQDVGSLNGFVLEIPGITGCPAVAEYGHASYPETVKGAYGTGTCDPGFTGSPKRLCTATGAWATNFSPACSHTTCPVLYQDHATFQSVSAFSSTFGVCDTGYLGGPLRTCQIDGTWGPSSRYSCVLNTTTCEANTDGFATWSETLIGHTVGGVCFSGFVGNPIRTCEYNGQWDNIYYNCKRKD